MVQETLAKKQAALKAAQEALATVLAKVQALKDKCVSAVLPARPQAALGITQGHASQVLLLARPAQPSRCWQRLC